MPDNIKVSGDFYTTEDGFGYDKYANTILKMIIEDDFPTPFTFGIFGEWGSGKTSLMRMVEKSVTDNYPEILVPVWFNPWRYEKEPHLIIPFLRTIQQSLKKHIKLNKTLSKPVSKKLRSWASRVANASAALASGLEGELDLKLLKVKLDVSKAVIREEMLNDKERLKKELEELEKYSSMYYDVINKLKEISIEEPHNLRIVVFIDDLDRCLPEKAIEILEGIKSFLDIPGYLFFIGVDRQVIEKGVKVKYKGYVVEDNTIKEKQGSQDDEIDYMGEIPITPSDYLEKIIQMPISLPPIEKSRIAGYLKVLLQENKSVEPYMDIIQEGLRENPRTYKRFINTLAFHTKLAVEKGCLKTSDDMEIEEPFMTLELLIKWTILNFAFVDLVEAMKRRKLLIVELQDWIKKLDEKQDQDTAFLSEGDAKTSVSKAPPYLSKWLLDEKLKTILRVNAERGDEGFSKENINLYVQMGEFTYLSHKKERSVKKTDERIEEIGKFVIISAGEFLFGETKKKETLSEYEIGVYPVTNKEYRGFLVSNPKHEIPKHLNKKESPEDIEIHPVVNVNYHDALAYCKWRTETEKGDYEYSLPSEEEWEKAARGTDGRNFPWGDEFDMNKCNTQESGIGGTTPVNHYPDGVSPFGCYDMSGNVWEWTSTGSISDKKRIRGGAWLTVQDGAKCSNVNAVFAKYGTLSIGFRCVRTLKK